MTEQLRLLSHQLTGRWYLANRWFRGIHGHRAGECTTHHCQWNDLDLMKTKQKMDVDAVSHHQLGLRSLWLMYSIHLSTFPGTHR